MSALAIGFGMGLFVAAQIRPMSLFLIRTTLRGSVTTGLAIGAGIAVIDTLYAAAGAAGAAATTGGAVLLVCGVGLSSLASVSLLALGVTLARKRLSPRMITTVDAIAGGGMVACGGLLAYRTLD